MKWLVGILKEDLPFFTYSDCFYQVPNWVSVRSHLIVYFQFVETIWRLARGSTVQNSREDSQALLDPVGAAAVHQELIQAHHAVLVDVHAGEHLLHVLRLDSGVNLGSNQVVDGICDLGRRER